MSEDLQTLTNAIVSLKAEDNLIKDYLYPVILAFVSALMGGFIGYLGILSREKKEIEKAKVDAATNLLLEATDCFHNLLAMKDNYQGKLTGDPMQRLTCVPPILMEHSPVKPSLADLLFITRGAEKAIADGLIEDNKKHFLNISEIKILFENYNSLFEMWRKRNELAMPLFQEIVSRTSGTARAEVSFSTAVGLVGHGRIAQLIALNERILSSTDDLLEGFVKLIDELPELSEQFISGKVLKKHGRVIRCSKPRITEEFLIRVPVNEEKLKAILST